MPRSCSSFRVAWAGGLPLFDICDLGEVFLLSSPFKWNRLLTKAPDNLVR